MEQSLQEDGKVGSSAASLPQHVYLEPSNLGVLVSTSPAACFLPQRKDVKQSQSTPADCFKPFGLKIGECHSFRHWHEVKMELLGNGKKRCSEGICHILAPGNI